MKKMKTITSFKAYDIRGELGVNLDEDIAYRIGRAFAQILLAQFESSKQNDGDLTKTIVIGSDIRESSESLKQSAIEGILDAGVNVIDLGMTGTEEVYFATSHHHAMGGIEVTASHNPINYNGLKLVREGSRPISSDTGLADIQKLAESGDFAKVSKKGEVTVNDDKSDYVDHLLGFIDTNKLKPLKLVINSGNGSAGPVIDAIQARLQNTPIEMIKLHHTPDGTFPNGIPNPMIIANQTSTRDAVIQHGADLGIAFDGDFDRCFFFDETGAFVDGSQVVGMLAQAFLQKPGEAGASIVYDPRVLYNTEAIISENNGEAVISKSGHSFIKQVMRESNAVYGGEMSAHHYFRDFFYCDSGMIPWLLTIELLSTTGKKLSELVNERIDAYPSSGEINFRLSGITAPEVIKQIETHFMQLNDVSPKKSTLDGLSLDFGEWRFNLRASNTEPLIRLNIETKGDKAFLDKKVDEIKTWLSERGATEA